MRGIFGIETTFDIIISVLFLLIVLVIVGIFVIGNFGNFTFDSCWAKVNGDLTKIELRLKGPQLPVYEREDSAFTMDLGSACTESIEFVDHPIGREYRAFWGICEIGKGYILGSPTMEDKSWTAEPIEKAKEKLKRKNPICRTFSKPFDIDGPRKLTPGTYCVNVEPVSDEDEKYKIKITEGACEE